MHVIASTASESGWQSTIGYVVTIAAALTWYAIRQGRR